MILITKNNSKDDEFPAVFIGLKTSARADNPRLMNQQGDSTGSVIWGFTWMLHEHKSSITH